MVVLAALWERHWWRRPSGQLQRCMQLSCSSMKLGKVQHERKDVQLGRPGGIQQHLDRCKGRPVAWPSRVGVTGLQARRAASRRSCQDRAPLSDPLPAARQLVRAAVAGGITSILGGGCRRRACSWGTQTSQHKQVAGTHKHTARPCPHGTNLNTRHYAAPSAPLPAAERALETLNYHPVSGRPIRIMWSHRDPAFRKVSGSRVAWCACNCAWRGPAGRLQHSGRGALGAVG